MQTYQQTIQAGAAWSMNTAGRYFRIIEAPDAPVDIIFFRNGIVSGNAQGVGPGYWSRPAEFFSRIEISSPVTQTVKVAIADGEGGYDVVGVTGVVGVVDGAKSLTLAGQSFFDHIPFAATTNNATIQLWNPVGSGVRAIVKKIRYQNRTAGSNAIAWGIGNTALTTLYGNGQRKLIGGGGAVSKCQSRTQDVATAWSGYLNLNLPLNVTEEWRAEEPFIILPGNGLKVGALNSGAYSVAALFEWYEEPI